MMIQDYLGITNIYDSKGNVLMEKMGVDIAKA